MCASNPWWNNFNNAGEQGLYEDLVVESIKIYGHDMLYLPRTGIQKDDVLNEYKYSEFNSALPIEMYVKNFDSFEGEGQLLAKFGLEIRDQMTLVMSHRSFHQFIKPTTAKARPWEGDCIYIPMLNVVYQIKYVNTSATFYTLGKLNTYEIVCELLEFNNEQFNTGVAAIDDKYAPFENAETDVNYDLESYDNNAQNRAFEDTADGVLDFSESSPFDGQE